MKRVLLIIFLLSVCASAQMSLPPYRVQAADPASCSVASGDPWDKFYYNTTSKVWKYCSATDTWTSIGDVAGYLPLTGGTLSGHLLFSADATYDIGASGATRPRDYFGSRDGTFGRYLTVGNCTFGVIAAGGAYCPDGFFPTSEAQDGTAVLGKLVKQSGTSWTITTGVAGDKTIPTFPVAKVVDATHI